MKRQIQYILLLKLLFSVSSVFAHSQPLPLISNQIRIEEKAITCLATIPTFALKPMAKLTDTTTEAELAKHHDAVARILDSECPVEVDGIHVKPVITEITIYSPPTAEPAFDVEPLASPWTELYIKFKYGLKVTPRQIKMVWKLFPQKAALESGTVDQPIDDLNEVISKLRVFGQDRYISFVPDETEFNWYGDGAGGPITEVVLQSADPVMLPVVTLVAGLLLLPMLLLLKTRLPRGLVLAAMVSVVVIGITASEVGRIEITPFWKGDAGPTEAEAKGVFASLHANVYRAFDYKTEDDIYDALAQSVAGEMLKKIYKDVYHGNVADEDGAMCQIDRVKILDSKLLPDGNVSSFRMSCNWSVTGLVEHWGHVHRRVNQYDAVYTVKAVDNKWKIVDVALSGHRRITKKK